MCIRHAISWCRWLRAVGLPTAHIATVLDLEELEVDSFLRAPHAKGARRAAIGIPSRCTTKRLLPRRAILGETGTYIRRLCGLGYDAKRIAVILVLRPGAVAEFISRVMSTCGKPLAKPRTSLAQRSMEARRLEREKRRANAATAAADWARWNRPEPSQDDADPHSLPSVELASEPMDMTEPIEPKPNRWVGSSRFQEGMASRKLTHADRQRIRDLRSEGLSTGELAAIYGVTRGAICYSLAHWNGEVSPRGELHDDDVVAATTPLPC